MWVCGLKHPYVLLLPKIQVAPYVGVWIETCKSIEYVPIETSHPMWVCGLKLSIKGV